MDKNIKWCRFFPKYVQFFLVNICVFCFLSIFSSKKEWVENYYSITFYQHVSFVLRFISGWLNFSIGDLFYLFCFIAAIYKFIMGLLFIKRNKLTKALFTKLVFNFFNFLFVIYSVFYVLWGLNYHREGIAKQLNIRSTETYTNTDLRNFTCNLLDELNFARLALGDSLITYPTTAETYKMCTNAYKEASTKMAFFSYKNPSIKSSMLTEFVSYAGYSGYYNPFTGEAQINTDLPQFVIPFVAAHEMAHQIGYASESEANFVSYIICSQSSNKWLRYSALFELFSIANAELLETDFWSGVLNIKSLHPLVKRDKRIYRNYLLGKQSYIEPVMKNLYHQYLIANAQQSGINSYNEVTAWVIAYNKKYGKHKLY